MGARDGMNHDLAGENKKDMCHVELRVGFRAVPTRRP
jgi:hypothetical protein